MKGRKILGVMVLAAVFLTFGALDVYSAPPGKQTTPPKAAPPKGKELYGMVWTKVRLARQSGKRLNYSSGAVAGVRGARTDKTLQPYWKGDKTKLTPEMEDFSKAAGLMNREKYDEAVAAFEAWLTHYPKSDLAPRVKIGIAISYANLGKKTEASALLIQWLKDYPSSEFEPSVKQLLADISQG